MRAGRGRGDQRGAGGGVEQTRHREPQRCRGDVPAVEAALPLQAYQGNGAAPHERVTHQFTHVSSGPDELVDQARGQHVRPTHAADPAAGSGGNVELVGRIGQDQVDGFAQAGQGVGGGGQDQADRTRFPASTSTPPVGRSRLP